SQKSPPDSAAWITRPEACISAGRSTAVPSRRVSSIDDSVQLCSRIEPLDSGVWRPPVRPLIVAQEETLRSKERRAQKKKRCRKPAPPRVARQSLGLGSLRPLEELAIREDDVTVEVDGHPARDG